MSHYKRLELIIKQPTFKLPPLPFEETIQSMLNKPPPKYGKECRNLLFTRLRKHYLAHGSYGACYEPILQLVDQWQSVLEYDPAHFFYNVLYDRIILSIFELSKFINSPPPNLVFVKNVEEAIQCVLDSIGSKQKQVGYFDFGYQAVCSSIIHYGKVHGYTPKEIKTQLPLSRESILRELIVFLESNIHCTLVVFEHITWMGQVLPVREMIKECRKRRVLTLIDGAHSVGQIGLDMVELDCDYYTSNLHKWMCSPRGVGFLYSKARDVEARLVSWGYGYGYQSEFIWQGTGNYIGIVVVPMLISIHKWLDASDRNNRLAKWTGIYLSSLWNTHVLCNDFASIVSVCIPFNTNIHDELWSLGIQVPIIMYNDKKYYCRVSINSYVDEDDIVLLGTRVLALSTKSNL